MNYGISTRVATLLTAAIFLLVFPLVLDDYNLQKVYLLYALLPIVALVDFGLIARIFASNNTSIIAEKFIVKSMIVRCFLISLVAFFFISFIPMLNITGIFILILGMPVLYISLVFLAYIESLLSYSLAYKIRFFSEILAVFFVSLYLLLGWTDPLWIILLILTARSFPTLLYFTLAVRVPRSLVTQRPLKYMDLIGDRFTIQTGAVALFGYGSGQATNIIVALNYTLSESLSYNQSFMIVSTIFSLVMSYFIYFQVTFKRSGDLYSFYKLVRKKYFKFLAMSYVALAVVFFIIITIVDLRFNIVKFDIITYTIMTILFFTLIWNHVAVIVYRVNASEILFDLSIYSSLSVIMSFFILGFFFDLKTVLLINLSIAIFLNLVLTTLLLKRRAKDAA